MTRVSSRKETKLRLPSKKHQPPSPAWWCTLVSPASQEAEAGGVAEDALCNLSRPCLKKKNKELGVWLRDRRQGGQDTQNRGSSATSLGKAPRPVSMEAVNTVMPAQHWPGRVVMRLK